MCNSVRLACISWNTVYPGKVTQFFPQISPDLKVGGAAVFPGADCRQSSTIPPLCLSRALPGCPIVLVGLVVNNR